MRAETGILLAPSTNLPAALAVFAVALVYLCVRVPGPDLFLASDDQGYQMALGMAVATGRYPGLDFVTQYGPLVAISSFLGWTLTGSVIGEVLLSVTGYAATIALAYRFLARHTNALVGMGAALALLALFPRFYKWYYWLFPVFTIVLADRFAVLRLAGALRPGVRRALLMLGITVGIAGLFRYDLLLEGVVYGVIVIAALDLAPDRPWVRDTRAVARDIATYVMACLAPAIVFAILIQALRGTDQLVMVGRSVVDGATDTVEYYLVRPFHFTLPVVTSSNALALLQLATPLLYACCVLWSLRLLRSDKPQRSAEGAPLLCAALMGLGLFPQALHRADVEHLLQVIPPLVLTLALLLHAGLRHEAVPPTKRRALAAVMLGGILLLPVAARAGSDLGSRLRNPFAAWSALSGLPQSARNNSIADMAEVIRGATPPGSSVFLVMPQTKMSMLFFAQRHQPGLFPTYEPGMFSDAFWLERNEAALREDPPDYLVLPGPGAPAQMRGFPAPYLSALLGEWQQSYRRVVYSNAQFVLLARSPQ